MTNIKIIIVAVLGIGYGSSVASASPLYDINILGGTSASGPFSPTLTVVPGQTYFFELTGQLVSGATNTQGTTVRTISSITAADGANSLSLNIVDNGSNPIQASFNGLSLQNGWDGGTGHVPGSILNQGAGTNNEISVSRPIQAPGVFSGNTTPSIFETGSFTVPSTSLGPGLTSSITGNFGGSLSTGKFNGGMGSFAATGATESGADPFFGYTPLTLQTAGTAPNPTVWTGGAGDGVWATPGNWSGAVPGAAGDATNNTDTATFNRSATTSPLTIDAGGRNLQSIVFDTTVVSSMTIGMTTGPALLLTGGGMIQATSTVTNPQTVNAPLVLEVAYAFTNGATSSAATLSFGGGITPAATSGVTTLTLNGANTGANTISGILADNPGAPGGKLAVAVGGTSRWIFSGSTSTYTGGTTIASGATLQLAGSVSVMSQSMNIANSGSLVVASTTNQNVGTVLGTGSVVVNSGSLTAYEIRQASLTINGTGTVTLRPSGSGSNTSPAAPNNDNFSSNVNSLSIAGTTNNWIGTLDIGNNGLVVQYGSGSDPFATITNMIHSGYAAGQWTGTGITSSLARAAVLLGSTTPALNIGVIDFVPNASGFGSSISFEGQTITTSAVLVRLTYMDDLVLAGDMQQSSATTDALRFAANYGTGTTWNVGDMTHDGMIDTSDALPFAANYVVGLPSLDGTTGNAAASRPELAEGFGNNTAAVPEPASLLLGAMGAAGLGLAVRQQRKARGFKRR